MIRAQTSEKLARAWERLRPPPVQPTDVRHVCVVLASSRSGSSFLFQLLSRHPGFIATAGEDTPFFRMAGLGWVDSTAQSDRLDKPSPAALERVARFILGDTGLEGPGELVARLLLQRPELGNELEALLGPAGSWNELTRGLPKPEPKDFVFEEPPFIEPRPRARPTAADFEHRALLLKTSTHCYRVSELLKLFPRARYTFVYLARNPLGSINGLIDGWLSEGFHSHAVGAFAPLAIQGYDSRTWWKFDLPPGWAEHTREPLEDVSAFQWAAANQAVLAELPRLERCARVRYDELLAPEKLVPALEKLVDHCGLARFGGRETLEKIVRDAPAVMTVKPPAPGKWRARSRELLPLLERPEIRETAAALGFDLSHPELWP